MPIKGHKHTARSIQPEAQRPRVMTLISPCYQKQVDLYICGVSAAQWSSWSNWGECSTSCGPGTQARTRSCQGSGCAGAGEETRSCNHLSCAGQWTNWSSWGSCSSSCGTSRARTRSRSCRGPGQCIGESTQRQACASLPCPVQSQAGMSEWSPWGPCLRSCSGYQVRQRTCLDSTLGCSSPYYQLRRCTCSTFSFDQPQQVNPKDESRRDEAGK
jgi:hypothetical protein